MLRECSDTSEDGDKKMMEDDLSYGSDVAETFDEDDGIVSAPDWIHVSERSGGCDVKIKGSQGLGDLSSECCESE